MIRAGQLAGAGLGLGAVTVWLALLGLFTTPYLIHQLGASYYGVFALITIMSAYLSNLELGIGHATVRFLARARATGDEEQEGLVVRTSFAVFLAAAVAAGAIAFAASAFIVRTFVHGTPALHQTALGAIRIGAVILVASIIGSFASASLQALGRFQVLVNTRALFGTAASASAVTLVAFGGGLRAVLAGQAVITMGLCVVLCVALGGATHTSLRPRIDMPTLRPMLAFGGFVLLAGLGYQILLQGPATVLAGHAPASQVAAFAVPNLILQQLLVLTAATSLGFLPFASAASADLDRSHLGAVFRANLRLTLLVIGPIVAYLAVFGRPLLAAWIDPAFAGDAAGPLRWLAGAALLLALSAPPVDVARGLGRPAWVVVLTTGAAALAIGGSFVAVSRYGATGVAWALFAGLACTVLPFNTVVGHRLLGLRPTWLLRSLAGPLLAVGACLAAFAVGASVTSGLAGAVATGALGALGYLVIAFRVVLDDRERAALRRAKPSRLFPLWRTEP